MSRIESAAEFSKEELAATERDNPFNENPVIARTSTCSECLFMLEEAGIAYCLWNVFRARIENPEDESDIDALCRLTSRGSPRINLLKGLRNIQRLYNNNTNGHK